MANADYNSSPFIKASLPSQHVLLVELQRKPVNAFNEAFWTDFGQIFDKISSDGAVRAVVLASALPKLFTAGLDLTDAALINESPSNSDSDEDPARKAMRLRDHILKFQYAISSLERCRQPVILAAHGLVLGLGVDIACACDIRYAASDASFCIKEVDIGLASDIGTLARIPKLTSNASLVSELAFTARPFSPSEALSLGLVSRVVDGSRAEVISAALDTANAIANKSPVAVMGTKRFLLHARDHSVNEALEFEANWNAFALQTTDVKDAFAAFKSKKQPQFRNLPKL